MFESRLFVDKLIEMGAKIILCDPHRATVIGLEQKSKLKGTVMTSPDIRAGVAYSCCIVCKRNQYYSQRRTNRQRL